jgi:hypothetical protein
MFSPLQQTFFLLLLPFRIEVWYDLEVALDNGASKYISFTSHQTSSSHHPLHVSRLPLSLLLLTLFPLPTRPHIFLALLS